LTIDAEGPQQSGRASISVHSPSTVECRPAVADRFLKIIAEPGNQPAFIIAPVAIAPPAMWKDQNAYDDKWDTDRPPTKPPSSV